ncbi:MAG: hypothetical protein ACYDHY_19740, partial [Acidiferrobacterales bacterium]
LWCDYYKVWLDFEKEYGMNYEQIQAFIKVQVEEHLKFKDVTPMSVLFLLTYLVAERLNLKDVTSEKTIE